MEPARTIRLAPKGTRGWDIDLGHGEAGESELLALLRESGQKVEVKRDRVAWKSERVAVEFSRDSMPSGIATTEAAWWAFALDDMDGNVASLLLVPIERLKEIARQAHKAGSWVMGGDGGRTGIILVPVSSLF